ncbi:MAG: hypothetical protein US71_C0020G0004 [Parcubacteria group bacterium GW2011_GWD2_38_12]|nr:MAG: hypothetical protein US06_C0004G0003 [Parcubacteria group bacterium GW2011_GWC2_36_17]KKQ41625.1 MAG: hypothetical protein US61_C0043G0005 [Parcubacteria group bacterium GW2011_GWE2_37_8]KKQ50985.1 MAG: hypothetical protein US71_C0020G0004 [Parcubacteria group bacterium GW2011_GWD2_38_12]KKQ58144.1 MAG: hypothetical protein US78_C0022G0004 [Parcubacteria group bacterium GW2011_GWD1_38_16]KKQ58381.1 MAG: hypothetical protein US79_C0008G0004 [Parcubacteria group bacterium GW2011_GWC1_38_1
MLYISYFMENPFDGVILFIPFLIQWWWIFLPPILFFIFKELWLYYVKIGYLSRMSWTMLEISVPREVFQTPKAIENIFASLHSISIPPEFMEIYRKGKVQDYICLEMVGGGGKSHFYIRTPSGLKGYVSSQIYAHYPKAEIKEVSDYTADMPLNAPDTQYDLWGTEMKLTKEDGYPIKTYIEFEDTVEEKRIDPVSSLIESFAQLRDNEQIWIQILIRPTYAPWDKEGQKLVNKIIGKKAASKKDWADKFLDMMFLPIKIMLSAEGGKKEEKKEPSLMQHLSPGQKEIVESIERNVSKLGFDTAIRTLYIGKRDVFNRANIAAIMGFFKQFNTLNLNGFRPNSEISPRVKFPIFKKQREYARKKKIYRAYRLRLPAKINFIFNTEELATIFHFPSTVVEAPSTPRIEAKKAEPPINLPI